MKIEWDWMCVEIKDTMFVIRFDTAIMFERREELKRKILKKELKKEEVLELLMIRFIENSKSFPCKYKLRKIEIKRSN